MKRWLAWAAGALGCAAAILAGAASAADTATLTIDVGGQQQGWTRESLLRDSRLTSVTVEDDNLKRRMTFQAIPMAALLGSVPTTADATATTTASDGYISHLPARLLVANTADMPRAWLAVESPAAPWPLLKGQDIGPFRLIWTAAKTKSKATPKLTESLWTYNIVRIDIPASPSARFAAIRPADGLSADGPVMRGFATFQRVCFSCHSMNRMGDAHLGPDLNVPYNPVEYLGDNKLAKLIRDPQSVRWWPGARMPAIDDKTLSDADLKDLLAYLHHMTGRKGVAQAPGS